MTLHLREQQPGGFISHLASLSKNAPAAEGELENEFPPLVVDQRQTSFTLTLSDGSNPVTGKV
jgi:hypothetical protein